MNQKGASCVSNDVLRHLYPMVGCAEVKKSGFKSDLMTISPFTVFRTPKVIDLDFDVLEPIFSVSQ